MDQNKKKNETKLKERQDEDYYAQLTKNEGASCAKMKQKNYKHQKRGTYIMIPQLVFCNPRARIAVPGNDISADYLTADQAADAEKSWHC